MVPEALETPRMLLRRWRISDAPALRGALDANHAHLRPWIPFMRAEPRTLEQTEAWLDQIVAAFESKEALRYALWDDADELLGEVMLLDRVGSDGLELGYWLTRTACGRGLATEASRELVRLAFTDLGAQRVVMQCDVDNAPSRAVARKLGAVVTGRETIEEPEGSVVLEAWTLARPADGEGSPSA